MSTPKFRPLKFGVTRVVLRDGPPGTHYLRADQDLQAFPDRLTDRLQHWATTRPAQTFMARRVKLADGQLGHLIDEAADYRERDIGFEQRAVVRGDATSAAIAAASIVAKVTRDRYMVRAGERFPGWGFEDHFGYSTAAHRSAIQEQGVCELHRMSFQSTAYQQLAL